MNKRKRNRILKRLSTPQETVQNEAEMEIESIAKVMGKTADEVRLAIAEDDAITLAKVQCGYLVTTVLIAGWCLYFILSLSEIVQRPGLAANLGFWVVFTIHWTLFFAQKNLKGEPKNESINRH